MVTTVESASTGKNRALAGMGFDGVVRITSNGFMGTGALLYDGWAVLTAAHLFDNGTGDTKVYFETGSGDRQIVATSVLVHPGHMKGDVENDLAVVWLSQAAPIDAERYELMRQGIASGMAFDFVGYGSIGTGNSGYVVGGNSTPKRLWAQNQFDIEGAHLKAILGAEMGWTPMAGTQWLADFDSGTLLRDAFDWLANVPDLGRGAMEGLIAPGDSGGPAFVDGFLAGVASYTAALTKGGGGPDIDNVLNSSYGEVAGWQNIAAYQQWIDQTLRAALPNTPNTPAEVKTNVTEGSAGTSFAYFLLQFTGTRSSPDQVLSVDFATRDGTAKAGSDYMATKGTLKLYPSETQAVIPVEIIGDYQSEPDETFYLDVTNPVGGSFGDGLVKLIASRTIVNDDV